MTNWSILNHDGEHTRNCCRYVTRHHRAVQSVVTGHEIIIYNICVDKSRDFYDSTSKGSSELI